MKPSREELRELLRCLEATEEREIDCTEFLDRVAQYVESLSREEIAELSPRDMAQHLRVCPQCREEFEALLDTYLAS